MSETLTSEKQLPTIQTVGKKTPKKKYYIETFGCQMNVADSELIVSMLYKEGFVQSDNPNNADIVFINTCSIRERAEEKVYSQLGRWHKIKINNPEIIIGVLGCMAQNLKQEILENKPYVDIILGPDSYRRLPKILNRSLKDKKNIVDTKLSDMKYMRAFFQRGIME